MSLMQILRITNARLAIEFREMEVDRPRIGTEYQIASNALASAVPEAPAA